MNDDPSNPFAKLTRDFAARKGDKNVSGQARAKSRDEKNDDSGNDASLFLDAVSRVSPLVKKGRITESDEADAAPSLSVLRPSSVKGRRPAPGKLFGVKKNNSVPEPALPNPKTSQNRENHVPAEAMAAGAAPDDYCGQDMYGLSPVATENLHTEEDRLFAQAMQGVGQIRGKGRDVAVTAGQTRPGAAHDPAKALRDLIEGRVEFALHLTGEFMEGCVVGTDPLVQARLRAGQYSPEKHLDMHGMTARQAYDALIWFIRDAYQRGLRCVVVVTGRGKNSPDGVGVLRHMLQRWFPRDPFKRVVLAFCTARPSDGGPGATYVLLRKYKKNRGKIIWNHNAPDADFDGCD